MFKFLIGRLKQDIARREVKHREAFKFLIGRLKHESVILDVLSRNSFKFLIGRLKLSLEKGTSI